MRGDHIHAVAKLEQVAQVTLANGSVSDDGCSSTWWPSCLVRHATVLISGFGPLPKDMMMSGELFFRPQGVAHDLRAWSMRLFRGNR